METIILVAVSLLICFHVVGSARRQLRMENRLEDLVGLLRTAFSTDREAADRPVPSSGSSAAELVKISRALDKMHDSLFNRIYGTSRTMSDIDTHASRILGELESIARILRSAH